jgi:hypothetical protein
VILVQTQVIHVRAEVDIETAVAIVVGQRGVRKRSLRRPGKSESIPLKRERTISLVQEEQRAGAADDQEVLKSFILKVREQSARGIVKNADAGSFSDVFECAVSPVAVKPVGKTSRLADIEVVKAVVVEIARGNSGVVVKVNGTGIIEDGSPIVDPMKQLVLIRR